MENKENYRPNVAIIIVNKVGKVLWCKRKDGNGWQFPQGGLDNGESTVEAIYRETEEEVGLKGKILESLKKTRTGLTIKSLSTEFLNILDLKIVNSLVKRKSGF